MVVFVFAGLFLVSAIRIVPEYQWLVFFRLGRCIGQKGPRLVPISPLVDHKAENDKQAAILRAEGFALTLKKVFEVSSTVDAKTMSLPYLDTLKALGAGPATKIGSPWSSHHSFGRYLGRPPDPAQTGHERHPSEVK